MSSNGSGKNNQVKIKKRYDFLISLGISPNEISGNRNLPLRTIDTLQINYDSLKALGMAHDKIIKHTRIQIL